MKDMIGEYMKDTLTKDLLSYIKKAPTPYQAVEQGEKLLQEAGFKELLIRERIIISKRLEHHYLPLV
jgi:aspartyl aminopeptidase